LERSCGNLFVKRKNLHGMNFWKRLCWPTVASKRAVGPELDKLFALEVEELDEILVVDVEITRSSNI